GGKGGGGGGKAAEEGNVFRSFQQISRGIFGGMHEQVCGRDAGLKGAGRERRVSLRAAIGVRDGREISACNLLAIDVAPQQVLDTGAIGSGRRAENTRNRRTCVRGRCAAGGGKRVLVGRLLARGDRAHGGVDERNLGGEQVPEQTRNSPGHIDPRPPGTRRGQNLAAGDAAGGLIPR